MRFLAFVWTLLSCSTALAGEFVLVETPFDAAASAVIVHELASGQERQVATLPHEPGYGAVGNLSPNGRLLGVTVLETGNRLWRHAAVWVVDLESSTARRLMGEAVFAPPVWTRSGSLVALRATAEHEPTADDAKQGRLMDLDFEVVSLPLDGSSPRVLARDRCNWLDPVGSLASGEIAFVRSAWEGNSLIVLRTAGLQTIAELGPGVAAWPHLTPDRTAVAFQQIVDRREGALALSRVGADGVRQDLARLPALRASPVPVAGGLAFASPDGQAVELLDATGRIARTLWRDPFAQALVPVRASDDGRWLVVDRLSEGPARPFVLEVSGSRRFDASGPKGRWREAMGLRGLP
jgi:hypothetical protein